MLRGNRYRYAAVSIVAAASLTFAGCTGNGSANSPGEGKSTGSSSQQAIELTAGPVAKQGEIYGPTAGNPVKGGTLKYATLTAPPSLDPFHQSADARIQWTVLMYQGLMYAGNGGTPVPLAAKSVDVSEDGLTYMFTLRPGLKFSNGTSVTATDVAYSYNYIRNPKNGSPGAADFGAIQSVTAEGSDKVVFHLSVPDAALEATVTNKFGGIVPDGYFSGKSAQADMNKESVGTGPYMLESFDPNSSMVLKKNPYYWGDAGYVDQIDVEFMPSEAAIVAALSSGSVDMAEVSLRSDADQLVKSGKVKVESFESMNHKVLDMNSSVAPLNKLKVRQAIASALSKETIAQAAAPGASTVVGTVPAGMQAAWGLPLSKVAFQNQNVDKAKKLLAEAGYKDGFNITLDTIDSYDWMNAAAAVIVQELGTVGIRVKVQKLPLANWIDGFNNRKLVFTFNDWPAPPDPDLFYYRHLHMQPEGTDFMHWNNKKGSQLLDEGRTAKTVSARKAAYDEFQQVLSETVPWYMIYSPQVMMAHSPKVQNVSLSPMGWHFGLAQVFIQK